MGVGFWVLGLGCRGFDVWGSLGLRNQGFYVSGTWK